jgi:hypothetical protein
MTRPDPVGETVLALGLLLFIAIAAAGLLSPWWWTP